MSFKAILNRLRPHEDEVYEQLNEAAEDLLAGLQEIEQAVESADPTTFAHLREASMARKRRAVERADRILTDLSHHFMPALEAEAVLAVVRAMGRLQGRLDRTEGLLSLYQIPAEGDAIRLLAGSAVAGMKEVLALVHDLPADPHTDVINDRMKRLHQCEAEADTTFRMALGRLFDAQMDPITLIKTKDLLQQFEETMDQVERVGKVVYATAVFE